MAEASRFGSTIRARDSSREKEKEQSMSEEQTKRSWGDPAPEGDVPADEANAILGEVPNRHEEGETVLEGARADMEEDLQSIADLRGKRLRWFVVGLALLVTAMFLLFFAFRPSAAVLTGGPVAKDVHGLSFSAPKGWELRELPQAGANDVNKGVALVNPSGDDAVRVMVTDASKLPAEETSAQVAEMCTSLAKSLEDSLTDAKVVSKASPIEGLNGCVLRGVGQPKKPIEDLNKGQLPGKTSEVVAIAQGKSGKVAMAFGAHSGETKFADGAVELSIMNQLKEALTK